MSGLQKGRETEPLVDELTSEAVAQDVLVTPDSYFAVDDAPADVERPPGAVEQAELLDKGYALFNGNPVDGSLFHPLIIWGAAVAASVWALGALATAALAARPVSAIIACLSVASLAALWLPLIRYRRVIDVVGYYVC